MSLGSTFHWSEARATLAKRHTVCAFVLEADRRWFESTSGPPTRARVPLVFPIPDDCADLDDYLARLPDAPGRHLVVVMQAGAVALARCDQGEVLETKTHKRYVVRGRGKAQPTHLSTKGKSRYGSRLRLRNARRLLEETNETLTAWWTEHGPAERVYFNAPKPLFASLFDVEPPPPFDRDHPTVRIPRDLPKPTADVVRIAYKSLCYGRIEEA